MLFAKITYDPHANGRNVEAIRALNQDLEAKHYSGDLRPAEIEKRLQQALGLREQLVLR